MCDTSKIVVDFIAISLYLVSERRTQVILGNIDSEKMERASEIFKGFGNPIRIKIIDALAEENLRVMELSELLGYSQPIISQQLKILKSVGIVRRIRENQAYQYSLADAHYSDMIKCMGGCLGI